jgi:hypothetical protein
MGQDLAHARHFNLQGYRECGVEPHYEELMGAWGGGQDHTQLPSSTLSMIKVADRKKMKEFDREQAVLAI